MRRTRNDRLCHRYFRLYRYQIADDFCNTVISGKSIFRSTEVTHPKSSGKNAGSVNTGRIRYTTSKLCNILCAYGLSHRLRAEEKHEEITVNAFNPGMMPGSGLAQDSSLPLRFAWHYVLPALRFLGIKPMGMKLNSLDVSGKALARLVTGSQLANTTGKYFDIGTEILSSEESYDRQKAIDLWEKSVQLVNLAPEETILLKDAEDLPRLISRNQGATYQPQLSEIQAVWSGAKR